MYACFYSSESEWDGKQDITVCEEIALLKQFLQSWLHVLSKGRGWAEANQHPHYLCCDVTFICTFHTEISRQTGAINSPNILAALHDKEESACQEMKAPLQNFRQTLRGNFKWALKVNGAKSDGVHLNGICMRWRYSSPRIRWPGCVPSTPK